MVFDLKDKDGKVTMTDTQQHDENSLIEDYRKSCINKSLFEDRLKNIPLQIGQVQTQLYLNDIILKGNDEKMQKLQEIFDGLEMNVQKRIVKLREKYSDTEFLEKTKDLMENSKEEIIQVGDKYEIRTMTLNTTEDLLIEFMQLQTRRPQILEQTIELNKDIQKAKDMEVGTKKVIAKTDERLKTIKEFFKAKGKDVDKLLDQQAQARPERKVAEALPKI